MIGAIIGDIVGSVYEFDNIKTKEFELFSEKSTFTDDTVMSIAIAEFLMQDRQISQPRLCWHLNEWYKEYPHLHKTYGNNFTKWLYQFRNGNYANFKKSNSFGNGAAMRVSSLAELTADVRYTAKYVTEVSHNHPEGIKGAQAVAVACRLAKRNFSKEEIKKIIEKEFKYKLKRSVYLLRKTYEYNETCQATVPEAIICFLESTDFEDAIRNAISIGGDSDTLACITGSIAENFYKEIPDWIMKEAVGRLTNEIKDVLKEYYTRNLYEKKSVAKKVLLLLGN
ncbi:ADP-ribosylglycohydrolase family protein [Tamlana flava]|uniref:ADP-ribosylglycohydrolase family protein n=1 Tax=Tamlana flava TaxID=3158572 RepID=UPI00351B1E5C